MDLLSLMLSTGAVKWWHTPAERKKAMKQLLAKKPHQSTKEKSRRMAQYPRGLN